MRGIGINLGAYSKELSVGEEIAPRRLGIVERMRSIKEFVEFQP